MRLYPRDIPFAERSVERLRFSVREASPGVPEDEVDAHEVAQLRTSRSRDERARGAPPARILPLSETQALRRRDDPLGIVKGEANPVRSRERPGGSSRAYLAPCSSKRHSAQVDGRRAKDIEALGPRDHS